MKILKFSDVTVTSRIPYKGPYVVKSQLVEQNDPFLINEIACIPFKDFASSGVLVSSIAFIFSETDPFDFERAF